MAKGSVNKMILLGRLGQDPEIRSTASGTQVANLSIATTEVGAKDASGNREEVTEWHKAVAFGKTAEIIGQYLSKGSQIYIEGRLQTRKWQDQSGADRYSTEIVINEMQFIGGKSDNSAKPSQPAPQQGGFNQPPPRKPAGSNVNQPAPKQGFDDFDDDIPY